MRFASSKRFTAKQPSPLRIFSSTVVVVVDFFSSLLIRLTESHSFEKNMYASRYIHIYYSVEIWCAFFVFFASFCTRYVHTLFTEEYPERQNAFVCNSSTSLFVCSNSAKFSRTSKNWSPSRLRDAFSSNTSASHKIVVACGRIECCKCHVFLIKSFLNINLIYSTVGMVLTFSIAPICMR